MGCASSSPMMNGSGGIVGAAKHAASDVVHAGEEVLHDVGETINGTVGHVKEAVVGAVQGIGHGLDGAMHNANNEVKKVEAAVTNLGNNGITNTMKTNSDPSDTNTTEFTYIPLKDPNSSNVDEHLEEFKENLLKKAQSFSDDTDKMADDLIKETEDVVREAAKETTAMAQSIPDKLVKEVTDIDDKTPTHSLDSLKTSSPEPEIEKALANDMHKSAPSPEPTLAELSAIKADEQHRRRVRQSLGLAEPEVDSVNSNLLTKYTKFFIDIIPPAGHISQPSSPINNNSTSEFDAIIENELDGNVTTTTDTAIDCGITQWEKLADAILATPVTRFVDHQPIEGDENGNGDEIGKL